MAFQTAVTIRSVLESVEHRKYVLPAIQREFVWRPNQIECLFDSLMRGYPIGSFLFWIVKRENIEYRLDFMLDTMNETMPHVCASVVRSPEMRPQVLDAATPDGSATSASAGS